MRMHLLSGGRLSTPRTVYFAEAGPEERSELPVSCALFRHPKGLALFDTGCHPDAADDAEGRWGRAAEARPSSAATRRSSASFPTPG